MPSREPSGVTCNEGPMAGAFINTFYFCSRYQTVLESALEVRVPVCKQTSSNIELLPYQGPDC